jgi:hypothetical protein
VRPDQVERPAKGLLDPDRLVGRHRHGLEQAQQRALAAELVAFVGQPPLEAAHLQRRQLHGAVERGQAVVRLPVGAVHPSQQLAPGRGVAGEALGLEAEPPQLSSQGRVHGAGQVSTIVVSVIVWLCRSHCPEAEGEISP